MNNLNSNTEQITMSHVVENKKIEVNELHNLELEHSITLPVIVTFAVAIIHTGSTIFSIRTFT